MLDKLKKSITLSGSSTIDGEVAQQYQVVINSENPEDINFSNWQANKSLYKENRVQCRKDEAEFEEMAYAIQDEMIAENEATEPTTEA